MSRPTHITVHRDDGTNERWDADTRGAVIAAATELLWEHGIDLTREEGCLAGKTFFPGSDPEPPRDRPAFRLVSEPVEGEDG